MPAPRPVADDPPEWPYTSSNAVANPREFSLTTPRLNCVEEQSLDPMAAFPESTSYSWVSGFEVAPNKATGLSFYYSGLYAQKNSSLNSDGTCCVGFGFPGASNVADRFIRRLQVATRG